MASKAETRTFQKIRDTITSGNSPGVIPKVPIKPFKLSILGAGTGPLTGLCELQIKPGGSATLLPQISDEKIGDDSDGSWDEDDDGEGKDARKPAEKATDMKRDSSLTPKYTGISNWDRPIKQAYGEATTLYEHKLGSSERHGDPIADVYAFVARPNNAILAIADGCNWGPKSRQAARCAVHGSIEKLQELLFSETPPQNTQDVVTSIRRSFDHAQELIMRHESTTTSLCVAVVCSLAKSKGEWGLCVVSVGNSSCFVWQNRTGVAYEVTFAAVGSTKDALDYGGCLGPSIGDDPDLSNLICCYATVSDDDVIFLTTDGISDNFDPVTLLQGSTEIQNVSPTLPLLTQDQRETGKLLNLSNVLQKARSQRRNDHLSALALNEALVEYVSEMTEAKQTFLERSWHNVNDPDLTTEERAAKEKEIFQLANGYPGKLDHATVVAYQVGVLSERSRYTKAKAFLFSPTVRFGRNERRDDDDDGDDQ